MTPPSFHQLVDEYLAVRRGLGFGLETPEWLLRNFASYVDRLGHSGPLTIELAVEWAQSSQPSSPAQAARRLAAVRQFARHRAISDPATEVPPTGLLGRLPRRPPPHIYTAAEVTALLEEASRLLPHQGLRPATYVAYFSLLVSTGLRLSEACRLTTEDVDLLNGILTVRETKFRKSRLVPLHATTTQALVRYADHRDACRAASRSEYFFRTEHSPRLTRDAVEKTFSRLKQELGWTGHGRTRQPRIHDMRHSFITRRLLRWYQDGADVDRKMLALATYVGHAKVTDTYWYCTAVPELLACTSQRFERFAPPEPGAPVMTSVERAFPALLRDFFHQRLVAQRGASAHTIASYRDTFTLFLGYAAERTGRTPSALTLEDLDAPMVLDHLETERGNSARTRNLRLTALRSFMRYASLREPTLLPIVQRLLAIPVKRFDRPVLDYLPREEITAIIDAPDRSTWSGQRDAVLFAVLYNTGARVSELIRLHVADVLLDRASSLLLHGKGTQGACRPTLEEHRNTAPGMASPNRPQPRRHSHGGAHLDAVPRDSHLRTASRGFGSGCALRLRQGDTSPPAPRHSLVV